MRKLSRTPLRHRTQQSTQLLSRRLVNLRWACTLLAAATIVVSWSHSAWAEVIYSKSRRFRIPFQFDGSELKRIGAREIRLFASRDAEQWSVVDSVGLTETKFTFEAPDDGIYWFSVKSRAANGYDFPAGPHQPSLHILVDTVQPELSLQVEEIEPGRVRLTWTAADEHIDLNSLQMEFMEPGTSLWQPVAVRSQDRGSTSWTLDKTGNIQIRGRVSDLAGNLTTTHAEAVIAGMPERPNARPDVGKPVAQQMDFPPSVLPMPAQQVTQVEPRLISSTANTPIVRSATELQPLPSTGFPMNTPETGRLPEVRYVNSTMFRIGYHLQEIGPSGISQVDLYITEDDGQKWYHYGLDPDRVSPMEVTIPRDGAYGFSFRVTNGLGRKPIPPQPGEKPEVSMIVDRVAPAVQLDPLSYASPGSDHDVLVSWQIPDQDLADQSVALSYSVSPTGPWIPIFGWERNPGSFTWSVPPTLEQQFHVRLDVRDRAGNIARVISQKPFQIDRAQPRARVTEIHSLEALPQ